MEGGKQTAFARPGSAIVAQCAGHWKTLLRKGAGPNCVGLELGDWDQGPSESLFRFGKLASAKIWACMGFKHVTVSSCSQGGRRQR